MDKTTKVINVSNDASVISANKVRIRIRYVFVYSLERLTQSRYRRNGQNSCEGIEDRRDSTFSCSILMYNIVNETDIVIMDIPNELMTRLVSNV